MHVETHFANGDRISQRSPNSEGDRIRQREPSPRVSQPAYFYPPEAGGWGVVGVKVLNTFQWLTCWISIHRVSCLIIIIIITMLTHGKIAQVPSSE